MSTVRLYFDALEYVRHSKELGVPELIAEYQARVIENQTHQIEKILDQDDHRTNHLIEEKLNSRELATKYDILLIQKDIELVRSELKKDIEIVRSELKKDIAISKNQVIIWVAGIMSTLLIASGLIQHFIK